MSQELDDGLVAPAESSGPWQRAAWRIGVEVAGPAADDVDRQARFPSETLEALKAEGFLAALLPKDVGGGGASVVDVVGAVRALASHCASSAQVFAMHSIEAFILGRHGTSPGLKQLQRDVVDEGLLLANANSEVGLGGDLGRSICALDTTHEPYRLDKQALAISYGEAADVILTKTRRCLDADEGDQVFVACRKPAVQLEPISDWDTLGLRGTCSAGYRLLAEIDPTYVFPVPFASVANDGGGQVFQLMVSGTWVGLAEAAAARAHAFIRTAARKSVGTVPPGALRVAEIAAELQLARNQLVGQAMRFAWLEERGDLQNAGFVASLRNLKITSAELGVRVATAALGVCGIAGYRRGSEYSLDRIIRDAHGGLIMVSNDRYLNDNAQLLLARHQL